MSVSPISSSDPFPATVQSAFAQQQQKDFQTLAGALKSGDLKTAQAAFADLQSLQRPSTATQSANSNLQALGQALQSGDLAGAQAAFAALQKGHHGHHHHHHGSGGGPTTALTTPAASDPASQPTGTMLNVKA